LNCATVWARARRPSPTTDLAVYRDRDVAHRTGYGIRAVASVQVDPQGSAERASSRLVHAVELHEVVAVYNCPAKQPCATQQLVLLETPPISSPGGEYGAACAGTR
jgi:hypothetical protein